MGQSASKAAAEGAKRAAATSGASSGTVPQRTRVAAAAARKKRSAASSSTPGARNDPYEDAVVAPPQEMPPELVKFLNDAGPLKRTVDKDRTSTRVWDSLAENERAGLEEQAKQANRRVRRRMPIVTSRHVEKDGGEDIRADDDGTMTERTTNFSTTDRSNSAPAGLGVSREDLFRILGRVGESRADSPEWKRLVEDEYRRITKHESETKNFDQLKDVALFENSLRYIGVPVLMKDQEGDIIGIWRHKSDDIKFGLGLKEVPERSVQFVMLNEGYVAKEA
mmetsp:Transcript_27771/g.59002  ORF Transcript_27771/g.59002 Transcript_27771/m.59002 type:complete len:280 (+) Transcript_27771:112-951(+)